jgi:hypothetical protein
VEWILKNSGVTYACVHSEDPSAEMDDAVAAFLKSDLKTTYPNTWFEENFNAQRQTEQLHHLITALHKQRTPAV